jgi:hypothetical protein
MTMVIDDGGAIWLSNPWVVAIVVTFAVGLVLWCHRWLETGSAPTPRHLSARSFRMAERRSRTLDASAPAPIRPVLRTRANTIGARAATASTLPRNAA